MMNLDKSNIQKRFEGVRNTHELWTSSSSITLNQFKPNITRALAYNSTNHPNNLRLGKQVESFIEYELNSDNDIQILEKNIQIRKEKLTVGELDLLIKYKENPLHLEIVYKFYLYNPKIGNSFFEHWIGPNNNDSLIHKLDKLQNKQLPLLKKEETKPFLKTLNLKSQDIRQYVIFKAQLFLPLNSTVEFKNELNEACVVGQYIELDNLNIFEKNAFFIPTKLDWLIETHNDVSWSSYKQFFENLKQSIEDKRAILFWMKTKTGKLSKNFLYFNPK